MPNPTVTAHPVARLEDLIERLGRASFITTLDFMQELPAGGLGQGGQALLSLSYPTGASLLPFDLQGAPASGQHGWNSSIDVDACFLDV